MIIIISSTTILVVTVDITSFIIVIVVVAYVMHRPLCSAAGLAAPPVAAGEPEDLEAANPWAMLLRTLLPWINAGQVPDYDQQEDEAGPEGRRDNPESRLAAGAVEAGGGVMGEADGADAAADEEEEDDLD